MKKYFILLLVITSFMFSASSFARRTRPPCFFTGKINYQKVKSFKCEIARAGTRPYLLASIRQGGFFWMIDLSGVKNQVGKASLSIKAIKFKGRRRVASFFQSGRLTIRKYPKDKTVRLIQAKVTSKNRAGQRFLLDGIFFWDIRKLRGSAASKKAGSLRLLYGGKRLKAQNVKITPWNSGYQISKFFLVRGGHTINFTIQFPKLKPGSYQRKQIQVHLIEMKIPKGGGKMQSNFMRNKNVRVRIFKKRKKLIIRFKGRIKGKKGTKYVTGLFQQ